MSLATMKVKVSEALASSAAAAQRVKRGASAAAPPRRKASRRLYLRGGRWIMGRFQRWTVRLYRSPECESNGFAAKWPKYQARTNKWREKLSGGRQLTV